MNAPKILLVDDDENLLTLMSIRLRRHQFEIVTATDGEQALKRVSSEFPNVVVTDLQMSGMDGMALLETLKMRSPLLPVIVLTAHGTIPDAVEATKAGVFAFLSKPFDGNQLVTEIRNACDHIGTFQSSSQQLKSEDWRRGIVTRSQHMERLLDEAQVVAASDASVLIQCESGTGKELLARAIHKASARNKSPFVGVNCTAIPEALFESELFGHVKGAFSSANNSRKGLFESAHSGTLFLDEIGDMSLECQSKLLRAIEEREVRPVGANSPIPIDIRIICATHQNLEEAVLQGLFREDLFYRLNVVLLEIPPLSERREDIPLLALTFLEQICGESEKSMRFTPQAMRLLVSAQWPGNIRQLRNVVEQCVVLCKSTLISDRYVLRALRSGSNHTNITPFAQARDEFEYDYLVDILRITCGNVSKAATLAKRNRSDFHKLLNKHKIDSRDFRYKAD